MTSTFHSIETSKRSLFAQQAAMNTAGHNISNVNTEGYSRQRVNFTESRSIEAFGMTRSTAPGQLGTGVEYSSITRIRTAFLDDQFRDQNQALGNVEVQQDTLDKLQQIFNEPSETGLRELIDNFWSSWSDLSNDPENLSGRTIVAQNAITLAQTMNQMSGLLSGLSSDLTTSVSLGANEINSFTSAIAELNSQIRKVESNGDNANDLRDQRDLYVDKLSKLVNVTVTDGEQGYTVMMGGTALVDGAAGGAATPVTAESLESAYQSGDLKNGSMYGAIYARDNYVADYTKQLDTIANTLANGEVVVKIPNGSVLPEGTVLDGVTYSNANGNRTINEESGYLEVTVKGLNGLHQLGYLPGSSGTPAGEFFVASDGGDITAANIQLNQDIVDNPGLIATSMRVEGSPETVVSGNKSLALLMAGLKSSKFTMAGDSSNAVTSGTMDDYFQSMVGKLGVQAQAALVQTTNQQLLVDQADSNRQSVSGVSLDEEMADLLKFQHAYSSAARFMTTMDQILEKLINGTGMVGR
ncbi:flagellar hook-associated protein FlgK [Cohnella lubricantis]|uniref:Flagellar hook-associated protein 1 n=1 Tax=Cohnella lubricantis TaxID=2163172 RepID=A0A841T7B1_9BACL|nr:flagellar hook-associated protein FlgK [Cohnella lubricantis]MBB6677413.1 flagellar hook-associated protein FlgK [Cohnella lubricantis]MBP2118696.1 flagellar hook-associated protein 1 FlgK [Cohnella lubricantis]